MLIIYQNMYYQNYSLCIYNKKKFNNKEENQVLLDFKCKWIQ